MSAKHTPAISRILVPCDASVDVYGCHVLEESHSKQFLVMQNTRFK